jgi:ribosomal protein S18 acetylase RimI-like enzyme
MAIRSAAETDAARILRCLSLAFEPYRERYTPAGYADTVLEPATIRQRLAAMTVFVATGDSDAIVGTIGCAAAAGVGHIRGMAVHPQSQGTGVAQQLLDVALAHLRAAGCSRVTLDTTEPLRRAIRFYERNGFRPTGVVSDFFGMPLFEYSMALEVSQP